MLNFTVGPVQSCKAVHEIGAENVPYFRSVEFSKAMLQAKIFAHRGFMVGASSIAKIAGIDLPKCIL